MVNEVEIRLLNLALFDGDEIQHVMSVNEKRYMKSPSEGASRFAFEDED